MAFRTVIISSHCKLEYSLNYLVYKTVDVTKRINLSEIHTLIIESTAVSLTTSLISELIKQKVKVIFCDEKRNPESELIPYYGDTVSCRKIKEQINWNQETKDKIWRLIVIKKILGQALVLSKVDKDLVKPINEMAREVMDGDITNREGHSAKYYFNHVFGNGFSRNSEDNKNIFLNYGYSIILSQFNRVIVSHGYLTQLGIHHKNEHNQFNLSCDLMEIFRPLVDIKALSVDINNYKDEMQKLLEQNICISGQNQTVANAIDIYCCSIFSALQSNDLSKIKFIYNYV